MQRFDFRNSTTAIKLYFAMILNLHLGSEGSHSEKRWYSLKHDIIIILIQAMKDPKSLTENDQEFKTFIRHLEK